MTHDKTPPKTFRPSELTFQPRFEYGEMAQAVEVSGSSTNSLLGSGYVRLTKADIPWQIRYDEVTLVLDGSATVVTQDATYRLEPQDSLWLPAGTKLRYQAESALIFYAIHPSNWATQEDTL